MVFKTFPPKTSSAFSNDATALVITPKGAAEIVGQMEVVPCSKWKFAAFTTSSALPANSHPAPPWECISIKPGATYLPVKS